MSNDPVPLPDDERLHYLASGFASGGLTDDDKQELYDLLRRPGEDGARTARVAWATLTVAQDLRGTLGAQFQDTVAHRLSGASNAGTESFVPEVFSRLGISRAHLDEVKVPQSLPAGPSDRSTVRLVISGVLLLGLLTWAGIHWLSPAAGRLTWATGTVTHSGIAVGAGASLDAEPVAFASGGMAEIALGNGGRVRVRGPASVVVQPAGVAVVSGEAWVEATTRQVVVGLPDGRLTLSPPAQVAVIAAAGHATVATISGSVVLTRGNASGIPIPAGRWTAGGERTFAWHPDAPAALAAVPDAAGTQRLLDADPTCSTWILSGTHRPRTMDDTVTIIAGSRELRLGAGWIEFAAGIRQPLTGAPLLDRYLRIERGNDGITRLSLAGLAEGASKILDWDHVPQLIHGTALSELTWSSGPAAEPARP